MRPLTRHTPHASGVLCVRFPLRLALMLLLAFPSLLRAQWIGDAAAEAHTQRGIDFIYNLDFDSAKTEFRQVVKSQPDHPAGYFFIAMIDWWRIVTNLENREYDERFIAQLDRVIDLCDERLDRNENDLPALFFKGGALGFRGRLHGNREDWVKAANDGRQALPIVQKAHTIAPENKDLLLGTGIYNYYAAVVPEQFPFVKPLMIFFPEGNKRQGVTQLRDASQHALYARVESTYFLLQLLYNFEKQYAEAMTIAEDLHRRYPNNPLFHKYVGRCQAALGKWDDCAATYRDILARIGAHQAGYDTYTERETRYYLGLNEMSHTRNGEALAHFYRADELSRTLDSDGPSGFMVLSNLRVGMIYDLENKRDLARSQYEKVLGMKDYQDAHDQARRYLQSPYVKH